MIEFNRYKRCQFCKYRLAGKGKIVVNRITLVPLVIAVALCSGLLILVYLSFSPRPAKAQPNAFTAHTSTTAITPVVIGPDLTIAAVTLKPPTPTLSSTGDIQVVVKNQGVRPATGFNLYLYIDAAQPPTATTPAITHLFFNTPLAAGGSFTWTRTAHHFTNVPPQIQLWVDPPWENRVAETNERNNLYPHQAAAIAQLHPNQAQPGAVLSVTVSTSNTALIAGRTYADFGTGITISQVTVISATQALINLAVDRTAAPGWRAVQLQSNGELITKSSAFLVATETPGGASLYIDPTPATLYVSETLALPIVLAPGSTPITGVQIHGSVDPTYLRLVDVISHVTPLVQSLDPIHFDPHTGEFTWSAGELGETTSTPFTVLTLLLAGVAPTTGTMTTGTMTTGTMTTAIPTAITFRHDFPATDVTGPQGSVLAAAYDGQVFVAQRSQVATVQGRIDLQGRPFRPHSSLAIPLLVEFMPTALGAKPIKQLVISDVWGEFRVSELPVGDYSVRIKGEHTLANQVSKVHLTGGLNQLYLGLLLEGDVETQLSSNRVVMADFSLLSGAFDRCRGEAGFLANADLNENGCVTIEDSVLVYANFNRQGDLVYATPNEIPAPLSLPSQGAYLSFIYPPSEVITLAQPITNGVIATQTVLVTVGEAISLPLYIDPGRGEVLGTTVALAFDPQLIEVQGVNLGRALPQRLLGLDLDQSQGRLRFSVQALPGAGMTKAFQVATLRVKLKERAAGKTTSATIIPVIDGPHATDIVGQQGSILAGVAGVTLVSSDYTFYLPTITR